MKSAAYFISDLHLDESRPGVTSFFQSFLASVAADAAELYILGDFFESWVGDDAASDWQLELARELHDLAADGCRIRFMHGNRDFLLGDEFAGRCGAVILPDPTVISLYGRPVVLLHGDSLCTDDHNYQKFRALTRDPKWQQTVLARPIEDRLKLAQQLRAMSQADNATKTLDIMDVNQMATQSCFDTHDCLIMIHGHTHRPALHLGERDDGKLYFRYVLGDWHGSMHYIRADDTGVRLLRMSQDELRSV